jgi:hypothetical protein
MRDLPSQPTRQTTKSRIATTTVARAKSAHLSTLAHVSQK